MKNLQIIVLLVFGITGISLAQKQNNIWFFGDRAGLDFNFTPPKAIVSDLFTLEGTATICDPAGHLLFYTNGATLWDRNQNVMPHGTGLLGGESSTQAALIVPLPNSCSLYYVFTTEDQFTDGGLAYSVVDMCLNGGLGDVVESTKNTLVIDKATEKVTAVLHANGVDIWILTHTHSSDKFQSFLLTSSGLNLTPVVSTIGAFYAADAIIGPIRASHDGSKIVSSASFRDICEMFDFNNASGVLSNEVDLTTHWSTQRFIYGIEFSPNDRLLYLSTCYVTGFLYQLNLQTDQVTTLNTVPGDYQFGALQMGSDKKIYMVRNESDFVDVINSPDIAGTGCQYNDQAIDLVTSTSGRLGLPNFAPYSFFQDSSSAISLGHDTTICVGDSIILKVQASKKCPSTLTWNDGSSDPVKIIKETGMYWVRVESSCAIYTDTIQINVIPAPEIFLPSAEFCEGGFATLDASFPGATYLWSDGSTNSHLIVSQPGVYSVSVTNACSTTVAASHVAVIPIPVLSFSKEICQGESFEGYTTSGIYSDTLIGPSGCDSIRILNLTVLPGATSSIEKDICSGGSFEGYTTSGTYLDTFTLANGCDSIRTLHLNVISCTPIIHYDLEACTAFMFNGTNMDYTEFIPAYPVTLSCADVSAHYLYRSPPQMNKHSCTPGVNGSIAMCVSSLNSCTYAPGHQASIVIEFSIHPQTDSLVKFTGLEFYEQAPTHYNWISGDTGPNNYPTFYGIRILKNGAEIYRKTNIQTANTWNLQTYSFIDQDIFRVDTITSFRIELLPYCPIGDASVVSAWDIDEVKIYAGCIAVAKPGIDGNILTRSDQFVANATIQLADNQDFLNAVNATTDTRGHYRFTNLRPGGPYYLRGFKNDDVLNGVSTLDLIRIQNHLLGKQPFTSLHQYIAADINHSGYVSVLDLIDLRKLLLGIYSEFPNNTSWRFGHLPQEMSGTDIASFQEMKTIEFLNHDVEQMNLIGIKTGDVNEDIVLGKATTVTSRSEKNLDLIIEDSPFQNDLPFTIDVKINQPATLAGIQLALDPGDAELISIEGVTLPVARENYAYVDNKITLSWNQPEPIRLSEQDVLFRIHLIAHHQGSISGILKLAKEAIRPEAYPGTDFDIYTVSLNIVPQHEQQSEIGYFQLDPNPFHSVINTRFHLVHGGRVVIRFFDISGRLLHSIENEYTPGEHVQQINDADLTVKEGVIYCQLICNGFSSIQRIVKI